MVKRYRDLTEKYRSFRLQPDAIYQSRYMETFFNKFTKKGKKMTARRHFATVFRKLRFEIRRPRTFNFIFQTLENLNSPFLVTPVRRGKTVEEVPTPIRRNKRYILNVQTFYNAVFRRKEKTFSEKMQQELLELTVNKQQSATLKDRNAFFFKIHDLRANLDYRWK
jgi:ribosomal protein S7